MIVYVVTFSNGKQYVGATRRALAVRRWQHIGDARAGVRNKFYNAIRAHGETALSWAVHAVYDTPEAMFEAEKKLIETLGTKANGYNSTAGGEGAVGWVVSAESSAKISQAQRARFGVTMARQATSASVKRWYADNPQRASELAAARAATLRTPEMRDAAARNQIEYATKNPEAIAARGRAASARFVANPAERFAISRALGGTPIEVRRAGAVVMVSPTLMECARVLGVSSGNIGSVLSGRRAHTHGYTFRRVSEGAAS